MDNHTNNMGTGESTSNINNINSISSSIPNDNSPNKGGLVLPPLTNNNNNNNNPLYVGSTTNSVPSVPTSNFPITGITTDHTSTTNNKLSSVVNTQNKVNDQNHSQFSDMDDEPADEEEEEEEEEEDDDDDDDDDDENDNGNAIMKNTQVNNDLYTSKTTIANSSAATDVASMTNNNNNNNKTITTGNNNNNSTTSTITTTSSAAAAAAAATLHRSTLPNNNFVSDEIVVDGIREWVPIHLLRKTKAKFWTHYLGIDKNLSIVKCKHCGEILEKFISSNDSNNTTSNTSSNDSLQTTKKLQKHLRKIHRLDPLVSYYADKPELFAQTNPLKNHYNIPNKNSSDFMAYYNNYYVNNINNNNNSNNSNNNYSHSNSNARTTVTNTNYVGSDGIASIIPFSVKTVDPVIQERQNSFPLSKLMAIIIASQNLSINFINDPAMKLLYSKLSKPYFPNQSNVKSTIRYISNQINDIVKRTTARNDLDLQLIIDVDNLSTDLSERSNILTNRLHFFLTEINKITLFSLTSSVWNNKLIKERYPINILSLQYYDMYNNSLKTIPLNLKLSESNLINTITIRNQLLDAYQRIPTLSKSTLSLTVSRPDLTHTGHLGYSNILHGDNIPTHNCIISILSEIVKPIFTGHNTLANVTSSFTETPVNSDNNISNGNDITGNSLLDPQNTMTVSAANENDANCFKPKNYYSNDAEQHLLDACVDLSNVKISNNTQSIFNRISQFYDELNSNPWQLERFDQMYKDTFNEINGPILQRFDKYFYSTAQSTLETFVNLKPIILNIQAGLQCENFKEIDFDVISVLLDFIKSINKLIIFFGTTKKLNFIYILFTILLIEKRLTEIINDCKIQTLVTIFRRIQTVLLKYKKSLLDDKMNQLALFCCPATLFDRDILEYVFKTVSLSEIVNKVGKIIRSIIKRFITVEFVSNSNNNNTGNINGNGDNNQSTTGSDLLNDNNTNINNLNRRFFNGNENKIIETEIDSILDHIINEDLYEYLSTVNTIVPLSYKAYCEQTGYVRVEGHFKKLIDNSNSTKDMTEVDQLLDIHIPVCTAFWDQYLANDAGKIVRLLLKIMITESSTSRRIEYEFLNNFIPKLGDDYLEDIVKIRLFNEQFSAGKVDYDVDTLATIAQYD